MKYFVVSDIHSFYTPLITCLDQAGYDVNNPEHIFVLNGDLFDRGNEASEVLNFVRSIPKERRILIRGNHEYLLKDLVMKIEPEAHDFSNGSVHTMYQLFKANNPNTHIFDEYEIYKKNQDEYFKENYYLEVQRFNSFFYYNTLETWNLVCKDLLKSDLLDWIFGDEWVNYFEIDKYIITHSFIPIRNPEWRTNTTEKQWINATWGCPYEQFEVGYFKDEIKNGKILVCGHWYARDFHWFFENVKNNNNIYFGDNLIAIDACTVLSGFVNVLVIDENFDCYDRFGELLTKERSRYFG